MLSKKICRYDICLLNYTSMISIIRSPELALRMLQGSPICTQDLRASAKHANDHIAVCAVFASLLVKARRMLVISE